MFLLPRNKKLQLLFHSHVHIQKYTSGTELHTRFYKVFDRRQTMHATKHGNSALFACRITVWNEVVSYLTLTTFFETYYFQWCSLMKHLRALPHNLLIKGRDIFR